MLVVETIAKIRRAYFGQRKPIKAICRELGVSRKVVRKVIRSGATEFRYEREVQPLPRIGPWCDRLDAMLAANEAKPGRERLTLIRLFEELRALGYGCYRTTRFTRGSPPTPRPSRGISASMPWPTGPWSIWACPSGLRAHARADKTGPTKTTTRRLILRKRLCDR